MTRATWWTIVGLMLAGILLLCSGCSGRSWRPAPTRTPQHDFDIRQLAKINLKEHPASPVAKALVRVLGLPAIEPDSADAPAIIERASRGAEQERAALSDWARGPGSLMPKEPTPAPSGAWGYARWLTKWAVIALVVAGLALMVMGVKGALVLRAALARGRAAAMALTAVAGRVDRAKAQMPTEQAEAMTQVLATVSPDVADTVREARLAAGTYTDTLP